MTSVPIPIASAGARVRYFVGALLGVILLTIPSWTRAGAITAASTSFNDVAAGVRSAKDGDTVVVPAGTASWTSTLTIKKGITLQGAGIGQTIIKDDLATQNGHLISITTRAGKSYRITGIEFQPGSRTSILPGGMIYLTGNSTAVRIDNCKFNEMNFFPYVEFVGAICGVVDHCTFIRGEPNGACFYFYHDRWAGGSWGDGSWSSPVDWGGPNAIYVEDCTFTSVAAGTRGISDAYGGARWVFRHNSCTNMKLEANHGTESTGRMRGGRTWECYENTFTNNTATRGQSNLINQRSGSAVVFNNTSTGFSSSIWMSCNCFRNDFYCSFNHYPGWGGADGTSGWDINDTTGGPNHDGIYLADTAAAGSGTATLVVSGANWEKDQWKGYVVRNLNGGYTDNNGVHWPQSFATIYHNSSDTITTDNIGIKPLPVFNAGDRFEIRKVIQPLDTIGASTCDLLSEGGTPPPRNLHQTMEPIYVWNNTNNGETAMIGASNTSNLVEGVNFINGKAKPGYKPYVYPHPLTKGLPPPEQMTRNATGNSQHNPREKRQPWGGKKLGGKKAKKAKEIPANEMAEAQDKLGN